jgi:hypothetical protein
MYASVASGFDTYGVALDGPEGAYVLHLLGDADLRCCFAEATAEQRVIVAEERGR